ncbi:MAG TPA: hypothetical protein PKC98_16305 [Candidatus Melainabacteria bacterium]|nr:hypothetical protein [Candidatus Melainabacteria bacterium]
MAADNLPGGVSTALLIIGIPTLIAGIHYLRQEFAYHANGGDNEGEEVTAEMERRARAEKGKG